MATRTLKLTLTNNLQIGDVITYQIYKKNDSIITYGNTVTTPFIKIATNTSAINNVALGSTKEETAQNIYYVLTNYNYTYTGLSYSYTSGEDNITITITEADGFDHVINNIFVPTNVVPSTDTPCDTAYIYNDNTLRYFGPIKITKGMISTTVNSPENFNSEIDRDATYTYSAATFSDYTITIPESIQDPNDVVLQQTNTSVTVTLPTYTNLIYSNYVFKLNDQPFQNSRILFGLIENSLNTVTLRDIWGCETTVDFTVNNLDYGFTNYPQFLTPVYNPVMYNFLLPNFQDPGFRYLINVVNENTNETISKFKITPQIDGSGYVDISKVLSNFTSVDFNKDNSFLDDAKNSYVKYGINLGYEYNETWSYVSYTSTTVNDIAYTKLIDDDQTSFPTFAVGDNIVIQTANGITRDLNGLHQVLAVDGYTITVDVPYVGDSLSPIGGVVAYADNRKTAYNNVYSISDRYVWNGALPWKEYKEFSYGIYTLEYASGNNTSKLLTSMIPYTPYYGYPEYFTTINQDWWFNIFTDRNDKELYAYFEDNLGHSALMVIDNGEAYGNVRQFKFNFNDIVTNYLSGTTGVKYIDFKVYDEEVSETETLPYRIYLDTRCEIEDYKIVYMDRLGSLLSYSFQLRATEKGTVDRDTFKKHIDYVLASNENSTYSNVDLAAQGTTTYHVGLYKELELNTNWMNDEMSVLFEELVTSPYTWLKIGNDYYACTVQEKSFEVVRQKNKNLIKKTVTVRLANDTIVNI